MIAARQYCLAAIWVPLAPLAWFAYGVWLDDKLNPPEDMAGAAAFVVAAYIALAVFHGLFAFAATAWFLWKHKSAADILLVVWRLPVIALICYPAVACVMFFVEGMLAGMFNPLFAIAMALLTTLMAAPVIFLCGYAMVFIMLTLGKALARIHVIHDWPQTNPLAKV